MQNTTTTITGTVTATTSAVPGTEINVSVASNFSLLAWILRGHSFALAGGVAQLFGQSAVHRFRQQV